MCSIINGDNPVACGTAIFRYPTTTQPLAYVAADPQRCDAAKVIERTYLLLSLLLGYLVSTAPSNVSTEPSMDECNDTFTIDSAAASSSMDESTSESVFLLKTIVYSIH